MRAEVKAAIYTSVSTTDQTLDNQVVALEAWAKQRGIEIMDYYIETETAWQNGER